jgi:hypothetical protein
MNGRTAAVWAAALCAALSCRAYDDEDWQTWVKLCGAAGLKGAAVKTEAESRVFENARQYSEQHLLLIVERPLASWAKAGLGFRGVFARADEDIYTQRSVGGPPTFARKSDHYWRREDRPTGEVTFSRTLAKWGFDDRVRLEYRMKEGEAPYFSYRNQIKARSPWKWTRLEANPYAAWEAFYNNRADADTLDRHRLSAGVTARLAERIKGDLYYMRQSDRPQAGWKDANVAGLAFSAGF